MGWNRQETVDFGAVADRFGERLRDVARMQRDQPNALESVDFVQGVQQIGERTATLATAAARFALARHCEVLTVAVHRLTEQRQDARALVDELPRFPDECLERIAHHTAAHGRHDAVRAVEIAAAHHRQIGVQAAVVGLVRAIDGNGIVHLQGQDARRALAFSQRASGPDVLDQTRQVRELPRTRHDVDVAGARENFVADALRHATHHADHQARIRLLGTLELAEPRIGAFLGVLAH